MQALHDVGGEGRYPDKVRQALQVLSTAVSRAVVLSKKRISVKDVGEALCLNPKMITECTKRFDALSDGEWALLFDERQAERSDKMDETWIDFALDFWADPYLTNENNEAYNFTRAAESMSKVVRDPNNRKGGELHRIHWLEESITVIYEAMLKRGKQVFGVEFHMSWPYFLELRPYYVKDATRETCMFVYHMRFDEMATALLNYRKTLRQEKISMCLCSFPSSPRELRKLLLCERQSENEDLKLDNLNCIMQRCAYCANARKLFSGGEASLCASEMHDPGSGHLALMVKYESYEKINYTTKDGTQKVMCWVIVPRCVWNHMPPFSSTQAPPLPSNECNAWLTHTGNFALYSTQVKKDFVSVQLPFSEFKTKFVEYWPKFIAHHNDAKWHDDDFAALRLNLPRGHVAFVIDFAENYSHEPKFEHQSKYFSQV